MGATTSTVELGSPPCLPWRNFILEGIGWPLGPLVGNYAFGLDHFLVSPLSVLLHAGNIYDEDLKVEEGPVSFHLLGNIYIYTYLLVGLYGYYSTMHS